MSERVQILNGLLAREVGTLLNEYATDREALITVQSVRTAENLASARIELAVFPPEKRPYAEKLVRAHAGGIQRALNARLSLRRIPKLIFSVANTGNEVGKVEELLNEIDERYHEDAS
ncbi:MAG: ribosome-binding factor A [Candidatus Spechtbacterales bacterium]